MTCAPREAGGGTRLDAGDEAGSRDAHRHGLGMVAVHARESDAGSGTGPTRPACSGRPGTAARRPSRPVRIASTSSSWPTTRGSITSGAIACPGAASPASAMRGATTVSAASGVGPIHRPALGLLPEDGPMDPVQSRVWLHELALVNDPIVGCGIGVTSDGEGAHRWALRTRPERTPDLRARPSSDRSAGQTSLVASLGARTGTR